mgnify:CR=1 FL=1
MNPATEGVETAWEHSWTWPAWATLALFLACAVLVLWLYRRERGNAGGTMRLALVALRVSLVALVLWMMYGWVQHRHRTDLPELIVVVDDSTSMTTIDRDPSEDAASGGTKTNAASGKKGERPAAGARDAASSTRFSQVQRWLAADDGGALKELERRYRVRVYMAGRTARPVVPEAARLTETNASTTVVPSGTTVVDLVANWQPTEPASRLGQCLIDVLQAQRGRPTAAVVLLSDGVTTEGRTLAEAADLARRRHVPLYCIGVGADRPPRDLRLDDLVSDDVGFVGDLFPFETRLTGSGYSGRSVRVRLVRTDSGAVLAEQTVTIPDDAESLPVRLAFRPKAQGELSLALVAESLPGEATTENNRLVRTVTIREEKLRVLLVQAAPSYEYRYLKTLLQRQRQADGNRERAVELTTVLQEADPEYPAGDETAAATFPANRDALFAYDVVVLGDADPRLLGTAALDNLAAFVRERGGGLIVCAGPRFMPVAYRGTALSELLPVEIDAVTYPPPDVDSVSVLR